MGWDRKADLGKPKTAGLPKVFAKASRRAALMDSGDLMSYIDASLSTIGRCLKQHRDMPGPGDHLRNARDEAAILYSLLEEAAKRQRIPYPEPFPDARAAIAAVRQG
jgi:hypothetical protein